MSSETLRNIPPQMQQFLWTSSRILITRSLGKINGKTKQKQTKQTKQNKINPTIFPFSSFFSPVNTRFCILIFIYYFIFLMFLLLLLLFLLRKQRRHDSQAITPVRLPAAALYQHYTLVQLEQGYWDHRIMLRQLQTLISPDHKNEPENQLTNNQLHFTASFWEANDSSVCLETPSIYVARMFFTVFTKILIHFTVQSQINPVHAVPYNLFNIHFNIIFSHKPMSSKPLPNLSFSIFPLRPTTRTSPSHGSFSLKILQLNRHKFWSLTILLTPYVVPPSSFLSELHEELFGQPDTQTDSHSIDGLCSVTVPVSLCRCHSQFQKDRACCWPSLRASWRSAMCDR